MRNSRKVLTNPLLFSVLLFNPMLGLTATKDIDSITDGLWKTADCMKVSEHAGVTLYWSGELLKKADAERKKGKEKVSDELYEGAMFFSQLSANAAKNFEVFCKG